jgi:hypothetical protein
MMRIGAARLFSALFGSGILSVWTKCLAKEDLNNAVKEGSTGLLSDIAAEKIAHDGWSAAAIQAGLFDTGTDRMRTLKPSLALPSSAERITTSLWERRAELPPRKAYRFFGPRISFFRRHSADDIEEFF